MIFALCAVILSVYIFCWLLFPDVHRSLFPYRFYNVLTNSMEPAIGTDALVLVKACTHETEIKEGDIITFHANRFGEQIVITHRFSHTQIDEQGETIYRTHPEGSSVLDVYETKRGDILGIYVCHIPRAGRLLSFLKSRFGVLWICQVILIVGINRLVSAMWKENTCGNTDDPAEPDGGERISRAPYAQREPKEFFVFLTQQGKPITRKPKMNFFR